MLPVNEAVKSSIEDRRTLRLKFSKTGRLIYISHLDLARTMTKILTRAGIPLWYTEGFNPRPKVAFSTPLSIGTASVCEYVDIKVNGDFTPSEYGEAVACQLPRDMSILDAYIPQTKFSEIAYSDYEINITGRGCTGYEPGSAEKLFCEPVAVMKKSKSGDKEINISSRIKSLRSEKGDNSVKLYVRLPADSENFINPELLVSALQASLGIPCADDIDAGHTVLRTGLFFADESEFR